MGGVCVLPDTTPPLITFVIPTSGSTHSGTINLKAECNEDCDYVNFWWRAENEIFSSASKRYHYVHDDGTVFEWGLNTLDAEKADGTSYFMEDGIYYLYAAGKDLAGNWARTLEIQVIVEHTKADILIYHGVPGKGIADAPGLQKTLPNDHFAENTQSGYNHREGHRGIKQKGNSYTPSANASIKNKNFGLLENAVEVSPGVFYLGESVDKGKVVEGYAFVHYAKPAVTSKPVWADDVDLYKFIRGGVKWTSDMTYKITGNIPAGLGTLDEVETVLEASLNEWNDAIGDSSTQFGLTDNENENNAISWEDLSLIYGANVIAVNSFSFYRVTKEMIESDVTFSTTYTWSLGCSVGGSGEDCTILGNEKMDLQNIATHEFGHNGLSDLYMPKSVELTMHGYSDYGETNKRTLGTGDKSGIQALYGN